MKDRVNDRKNLILNGSLYKSIFVLGVPLMIGNLGQTLYTLIDTFWVGKLGYEEIAAVSFVWPIIYVFLALSIGFTIAAESLISQAIGDNQYDIANRIIGQFFGLSLFFGFVFALIGHFAAPQIVRLMGASNQLAELSSSYLKILFFEMPLLFVYQVYKCMMKSQGETRKPTIVLMVSLILNICLDPILILIFDFGVAGAAMATVISRLAVTGYVFVKLFDKELKVRVSVESMKPDVRAIKNILGVGVPASLGQMTSAFGFIILNSLIISHGEATVAAFSIGNRIINVFMMPAFGISSALATIVSLCIGAGKHERAIKASRVAIGFSFGLLLISSVFVYITRSHIASIFVESTGDVYTMTIRVLGFICLLFPLMAIYTGFDGILSGAGHTKSVLILSLIRLWVFRIPLVLLFGHFTNLGLDGICWAMLISNLSVCVFGFGIVKTGKWQTGSLAFES